MRKLQKEISNNTGKVAIALAKTQMDIGVISVNKEGYNFSYLNLAGILKHVLPIAGKHGLAIMQFPSVEVIDEQPWIKVITRLAVEDEWIESELSFPLIEPTKKTDSDMSMMGSNISYQRRYALQSVLGIAGADKEVEDMQNDTMNKDENRTSSENKLK